MVAAILVLLVLTSIMLLALFTRTEPHPPLEVTPFALGPFLAASLSIGVAALTFMLRNMRFAMLVALLFALTALISYGPQKYVDPAFPKIWPAVILAQIAIAVIVSRAVYLMMRYFIPPAQLLERQREDAINIENILRCLNDKKRCATYGAVAHVLNIDALQCSELLGERRPEASWVVNADSGLPTKYRREQLHPDLLLHRDVISTAEDLHKLCNFGYLARN